MLQMGQDISFLKILEVRWISGEGIRQWFA
jgi:hypothetical protein